MEENCVYAFVYKKQSRMDVYSSTESIFEKNINVKKENVLSCNQSVPGKNSGVGSKVLIK